MRTKGARMVTKMCPTCQQQVPVACKACPCSHIFFTARRPIGLHRLGENREGEDGEIKCRRTERVRRERPDYFNALQIENQLKTLQRKARHRGGNSTSSSTNDNEGDGSNSEESGAAVRKRGRPKGSVNRKEKKKVPVKVEIPRPEKEEDAFARISPAKVLQYSVILAEINQKICAQQFKI